MNQELLQKFLDCNDTPPYVYGGMRKFFTEFKTGVDQLPLISKVEGLCKSDVIEIIYDDSLVERLVSWRPLDDPYPEEYGGVPSSTCLALAYSIDIRDEAWLQQRSLKEQKRGLFIYMRPPFSDVVGFNILLHEYCHIRLGHIQTFFPLHEAEAEAEFVSFMVRFELGIDTTPLSFQYVNHFARVAQIDKQELVKREKLTSLVEELTKVLHE